MTFSADALAPDRRVCCDDAVDSMPDKETRDAVDRCSIEIGCDLDDERHAVPVLLRQRGFLRLEMSEKRSECIFVLQIAQTLRIRRADVDGDVARTSVDLAHTQNIVVRRA